MRRKITLYLSGERADIDAGTLVLMNYKQTDASAPAAVYNAWSQSLALPRSNNNNRIFGHIDRPDAITRVNTFHREPFIIYDDRGAVVESGYYKLESITPTQYNVTLYGGLGGFLFSLMYNADGTKKTLADLEYITELDFNITRDVVRDAWRHLGGLNALDLYDVLNFAPCYNGKPTGAFDANKAFCPVGAFGVTGRQTEGADVYTSRNGHVLAELAEDVDEWAAADLRSYLQRPVLRMRAMFQAIADAASAAGYAFVLDPAFFNDDNPYYNDTWLTLGRLDELTLPTESDGAAFNFTVSRDWANGTYGTGNTIKKAIGTTSLINHGAGSTLELSATFQPRFNNRATSSAVVAWENPDVGGLRQYRRVVAAYQLVAYDSNGVAIGGSRVAMATTRTRCTDGRTPMELTIAPAAFIGKFNADSTNPYKFTPAWLPDDGDMYESAMYNGDHVTASAGGLVDADGQPINITLSFADVTGAASVSLVTTYLAIYTESANYYTIAQVNEVRMISNLATAAELVGVGHTAGNATMQYVVSGNIRSGAHVTQSLLLSGTQTPADYLLSYCKMFGLYITYDRAARQVDIRTRGAFYSALGVDLTDRVDVTTIKTVPAAISAHWYDFLQPAGGRYADYYKSAYSREYGLARYNTGYEFNADHNDVLSGTAYQGAAMSLHNNKYFVRISEDDKQCPAPFISGGKYNLWRQDGEIKAYDIACPTDAAAVEYINATYPGYDYAGYIKPEFCDGDGKSKGGADVLLFLSGTSAADMYSRFCLTDDNGLMTRYNDGKPCWLLAQNLLDVNAKYCINDGAQADKLPYPVFTRWVLDHSLDMGVPAELDTPVGGVAEEDAVFPRFWAEYIADLAHTGARVMSCKVNLAGLPGSGADLLRHFYYFRGAWWVLSQIKNYNVEGGTLTECEFIQVTNKEAYTNGQII